MALAANSRTLSSTVWQYETFAHIFEHSQVLCDNMMHWQQKVERFQVLCDNMAHWQRTVDLSQVLCDNMTHWQQTVECFKYFVIMLIVVSRQANFLKYCATIWRTDSNSQTFSSTVQQYDALAATVKLSQVLCDNMTHWQQAVERYQVLCNNMTHWQQQ